MVNPLPPCAEKSAIFLKCEALHAGSFAISKHRDMKAHVNKTLENAREYTLQVAAAMPESGYGFKPVDEVWTFNELLHHIGYGIYWWEENYIRQQSSEWEPPAVTAGKQAVTDYLEKAFADLEKNVKQLKEGSPAMEGFFATMDHITHHRGQATVYLRCQGITPPAYNY